MSQMGDHPAMAVSPRSSATLYLSLLRTFLMKMFNFSSSLSNWLMQVSYFALTLCFHAFCNPVVWFVFKTMFCILTEVFVYLVLGVCSFLISVITNIDEYYTKGKSPQKPVENSNVIDIQDFKKKNVRKFLEKQDYF